MASMNKAVAQATPEAIEALGEQERAAGKSPKQRTRERVRNDGLSCRVEDWIKPALTNYAKANGKKTMADGLHLILERMVELGEITKEKQ